MAVNAGIGFHTLQELERFFRLLGFVALVVLPQNLIRVRIHYDRLHCCRTHVKSDEKLCIVVVRLLRLRANRFCLDSRNLNQHWTLMAVMIVHLPSQENSQTLNRKRSQSSPRDLSRPSRLLFVSFAAKSFQSPDIAGAASLIP